MRSGLQNPGAIPLLAILVAALLSMTPIVCEAWMTPGEVLDCSDDATLSTTSSNCRLSTGYYLLNGISFDGNSSTRRLLQPASVSTVDSLINGNILHKTETWWQRVCRISPLASLSSLSASLQIQQSPRHHPIEIDSRPKPTKKYAVQNPSSTSDITTNEIELHSIAVNNNSSSLNKAVVDSSSPVERKGSFLAVMVSLIVAIMWF